MSAVLSAASVLAAGVPMLGFLAAIWWLDRYDREPIPLLAAVFLWGAAGAPTLALPGQVILHELLVELWPGLADLGVLLQAGVCAPLVEEPAKGLVLVGIAGSRHFDNMTDGFVYGSAAGLGFAMAENLVHFSAASGDVALWGSTVALRTFTAAVMHATASAVLGAALGHARYRGRDANLRWAALGLVGAWTVHAVWNTLATVPSLFVVDLMLLPLEVALVVLVFELCVWDESRTIREELAEEVDVGRLPEGHPDILARWLARQRADWLPEHVDQERYIRVATDLAFTKHQARLLGEAPTAPTSEIEALRHELEELLA